MAFKSGKNNIVSQQKARIKELEDEISRIKQSAIANEFINRVMNSTFLMLAHMPYDQWPELAKRAFEYERDKTPTAAYVYKKHMGWD